MEETQDSRAVKDKRLDIIRQECIDTVANSYPGEDKVVIFGEGNPDSEIVLVGEAPGEKETKLGRPFVGQAGKNLDEFLGVLELERKDIYITNTVKFRPFKVNPGTGRLSNRPPNRQEIELCLPYLKRQLEVIRPRVVVTLGNIPLKALTGDNSIIIGNHHGSPMDTGVFFIFPLYHPASIIYNASLKDTYREDLIKLKEFIER